MNETALFRECQRMILEQAHILSERYGVEFEDVTSQGYLIFVKTLRKFDPSKSNFSTYLYNSLKDLNNYCKKQRRYNQHLELSDDELLIESDSYGIDTFYKTISKIKENNELSDAALDIVTYILSREWDTPSKTPHKRKVPFSLVARHFAPSKYKISELQKCWGEIKEWWKQNSYAY